MAQTFYCNYRTYVLDFTKKKVRMTTTENGESWTSVEDKFSILSSLQHVSGQYAMFMYEVGKYDEIKAMLLKKLEEKQWSNLTIIK